MEDDCEIPINEYSSDLSESDDDDEQEEETKTNRKSVTFN